jgi:hypothetical protein
MGATKADADAACAAGEGLVAADVMADGALLQAPSAAMPRRASGRKKEAEDTGRSLSSGASRLAPATAAPSLVQ